MLVPGLYEKSSIKATEVEALAWEMWMSVSPLLIWWWVWAWVYGSFLDSTCNHVYFGSLYPIIFRFCQCALIAVGRTILAKTCAMRKHLSDGGCPVRQCTTFIDYPPKRSEQASLLWHRSACVRNLTKPLVQPSILAFKPLACVTLCKITECFPFRAAHRIRVLAPWLPFQHLLKARQTGTGTHT